MQEHHLLGRIGIADSIYGNRKDWDTRRVKN
jgi:hypothetical protein